MAAAMNRLPRRFDERGKVKASDQDKGGNIDRTALPKRRGELKSQMATT